MINRIRGLSLVFCIIILFVALIPATKSEQSQQLGNIDWKYSDLKAFDQPGEINPGADLVAVYFRESDHRCEIRLDLLASSLEVIPEAYFLIDFLPGGQNYVRIANEKINTSVEWDFALRLLPNDFIQHIEPEISSSSIIYTTPLQIKAKRNFEQDTIEIQFRCDAIGIELPGAKIGIILVDPSETDLGSRIDQSTAILIDSAPPASANILMLFTETFAGKTPAQAVKNWDGAHTGPESARHGLSHLLKAVDFYRVPVFLVDLKTPQNLSALDAIGVLHDLIRLEQEELLILPDYSFIQLSSEPEFSLPTNVYSDALSWSKQVSKEMGLASSTFFTASQWPQTADLPAGYQFFLPAASPVMQQINICKSGQIKFLCSPPPQDVTINYIQHQNEIGSAGLTISARETLILSAMRNKGEIVVFGGSLAQSVWGNIGISDRVFKYFQSHPWINPVNSNDLLTWVVSPEAIVEFKPTAVTQPKSVDGKLPVEFDIPQALVNSITERLNQLPLNSVTTFARQSFYALLSTNNPQQHQLNAASLGQIGHLIYAAKWASGPETQLDCNNDINWDGINECIISTKNIFASFDTIGGSMVSAFALTDTGIEQIATSSYQVANGLSDPFRWKSELGVHGDPDAPGAALVEPAFANKEFLSRIEGNSLFFESSDGTIKKEIRLFADRIRIDYQLATPQVIQFQSSSNPWERYSANWRERYAKKTILTNMQFQETAFWQPLPYLNEPEDPNFDYGRGFFTLFPFDIFTFQGHGANWLEIPIRKSHNSLISSP